VCKNRVSAGFTRVGRVPGRTAGSTGFRRVNSPPGFYLDPDRSQARVGRVPGRPAGPVRVLKLCSVQYNVIYNSCGQFRIPSPVSTPNKPSTKHNFACESLFMHGPIISQKAQPISSSHLLAHLIWLNSLYLLTVTITSAQVSATQMNDWLTYADLFSRPTPHFGRWFRNWKYLSDSTDWSDQIPKNH
jgi:hypothetical protein